MKSLVHPKIVKTEKLDNMQKSQMRIPKQHQHRLSCLPAPTWPANDVTPSRRRDRDTFDATDPTELRDS